MGSYFRWALRVWLTVAGGDLRALWRQYGPQVEIPEEKIPTNAGRIFEQLRGTCGQPSELLCQECRDRVCHSVTRGRALVATQPGLSRPLQASLSA
jgi:hypothetical protein